MELLKNLKQKIENRYSLTARACYKIFSKFIYFFDFSKNEDFFRHHQYYKNIFLEKLGERENCKKFEISFWNKLSRDIEERFLNNFPVSFLDDPVIKKTMFLDYGGSKLQGMELKYIKNAYGNSDLKRWLKESKIGHPTITNFKYLTSHNSIHHLYHLTNFFQKTGTACAEISQIVEWGGGYGNLAKIFAKINPKITYIMIDLPIFSVIQAVYLSTLFGVHKINFIIGENDGVQKEKINIISLNVLAKKNIAIKNTDLFISTWALSESTDYAQKYAEALDFFDARRLLIAHQQKSETFQYADSITSRLKNYKIIYHEKIPYLKNNYYLFCKK